MWPVADGLFEATAEGARLIGSRCGGCGALYFPQAASCRNPTCAAKRIERAPLPDRGTLVSYTVQRYRPPPLFRMDDWAPYAIGLVDLGEGLEVMAMLTGVDPNKVEIGMAVRLVAEPLYADESGSSVLTYKFAPAATEPAR